MDSIRRGTSRVKDVSMNRISRPYSYQEFLFFHERGDSPADLDLEFITSDSDSTMCVSLITLKPQNSIIDLLVTLIGSKISTDLA